MNPLIGFAAGVGSSLLTGAINKGFSDSSQKEMMRRQNAYNKEQMALQYAYNQRAQMNAAANQVRGLKAAGLSPALAAEGKFSPAAGVSPSGMPSSSPHNFASDVAGVDSLLGLAQARLVQNQAKIAEVEADKADIELQRMETEDATHAFNLNRLFTRKLSDRENELRTAGFSDEQIEKDKMVQFYKDMADVAGNAGASKAYNEFVYLVRNDAELGADLVEATLRFMIANNIIKDPDVLRKLSKRPSAEYDEILSEISRNYASAFASSSSGNLTYHNDLTSMIEKGDNLGTGVYIGKEIFDTAKSWSPFMLMRRYMKPAMETQKWQKALHSIPKLKSVTGNNPY